jgi:urease accessory protein
VTPDPAALLAVIQQADTAFPSGGVSFSSGVETLVHDDLLTGDSFASFLVDAISHRWNTFDRVFLCRAYLAVDDEGVRALDLEYEASVFGETARTASRRAGTALLGTWSRLDNDRAARYRRRIRSGEALGHLAVAQGLVFRATGLDLAAAEVASCWTGVSALASAAVRLGVIGHVAAQRILLDIRPCLADLLASPADVDALPSSWSPVQDIAQARHATAGLRLFAS